MAASRATVSNQNQYTVVLTKVLYRAMICSSHTRGSRIKIFKLKSSVDGLDGDSDFGRAIGAMTRTGV